MERADNTLPAASGEDPSGAFLEPFQAVRNEGVFRKTNLKIPLNFASPDVLTPPLTTAGKRLHPWDAEDPISLP